jgi:zinc transport system permease protein
MYPKIQEVKLMFEYAFIQNAFIVALLISVVCPLIGMFLVLRRYSMIGDSLAHASLAGVAVGLLLNINPILSAFCLTSFFGVLIEALRRRFRRYAELILVIVLSLSVGIAITIISSGLVHANVESFLFGSILTVSREDVWSVFILSIISIFLILRLYPQLVFLTFDEDGAKIAGVKSQIINYVFAVLVAATISVSIRIVGILVISSLIALPVATALQLQRGFRRTLQLSVLFSFIDILAGLFVSYWIDAAPGGVTAIASVLLLMIVMAFQQVRLAGHHADIERV